MVKIDIEGSRRAYDNDLEAPETGKPPEAPGQPAVPAGSHYPVHPGKTV